MRTRRVIVALLTLSVAASSPGLIPAADPPAPEQSGEITPTRVSYLYGEVSFWRPGAQEWAEAKPNTPLAPGDVLYTGQDGNVELQIGPRAFVRAGNGTQIGLDNEEPDYVQFRVTAGHAAFDVREIPSGHTVEIDTPNAAFTIENKGYYHVALAEDTTTFSTYRGGSATVTPAAGAATPVAPNKQIVIAGVETPNVETGAAPPLVVFLGGPVGVAVAARPVHWAPLGWGEPVIPWWGRPGFVGVAWWGGWGGPRVVNNVVINRTTNVNVTNINAYSNVHVHNAVVGVSEDRFGRGSMQTVRVDDARVRELRPVRGALDVKPVAASVMSADRAASQPPAAIRDRNVVATRTPRDFSPTLRAQGLGAERETPPSAPSRIVPAPKRTTTATPPSEGPSSSPRPRPAETPNVRRPDPSAAPNPGAGVPRPGRRAGASGQPDSGPPDSRQGKRPQADENERGRRPGPPPPPPAHNSAESRQLQPQGPEQRRRPEAKPAQPPQRSNERPPERTEPRQQEK